MFPLCIVMLEVRTRRHKLPRMADVVKTALKQFRVMISDQIDGKTFIHKEMGKLLKQRGIRVFLRHPNAKF